MKTGRMTLAFSYLRLSREEMQGGESSSITNQRRIIENYCRQAGITLVREFADDGWSGGNFDRPAFQDMMRQLENGGANTVITKDLSRLGRDMREASYYAEQFFPENGIRYIAIADNFDTEHENIMAPFQFAMNEVYLRDGSRKVKDVLKNKRENGLYCACPPYGYRKDNRNNNLLVPDEMTAPIVQRIFERAAAGDSSRKIAFDLNDDGIIPPLKYRVLYRDDFSDEGASRASDIWNYTTVKRILRNHVYLGHTVLGKSRKVSVKSKKKIEIPKDDWAVTENTHEALVSQWIFDLAGENLGRGTRAAAEYEPVRKSIFAGIAVCGRCGYSLCSCGTVYKGERDKYWYLSCTHQRRGLASRCAGVRIRYSDLCEIVRQDLNSLLAMFDDDIQQMVEDVIRTECGEVNAKAQKIQRDKVQARLTTIGKVITKLYTDYAEGRLDDSSLIMEGGKITGNNADVLFGFEDSTGDVKNVTITDNVSLVLNVDNGSQKVTMVECTLGNNAPVKYEADVIVDTEGTLVMNDCALGDTTFEDKSMVEGVGSMIGEGSLTKIVSFVSLFASAAAIILVVTSNKKKAVLATADGAKTDGE